MPSSACPGRLAVLLAFPTRRSSDLDPPWTASRRPSTGTAGSCWPPRRGRSNSPPETSGTSGDRARERRAAAILRHPGCMVYPDKLLRSEEHTSELQSPCNLVCRLLLVPAASPSYSLSLHDALPIWIHPGRRRAGRRLGRPARAGHRVGDGRTRLRRRPARPVTGRGNAAQRRSCVILAAWSIRTSCSDRKSTRLNSSHLVISYAVFCLSRPPRRLTRFPYTTLFRSGSTLDGVAQAVDWDGRLVLATASGTVELASGDVRHVR